MRLITYIISDSKEKFKSFCAIVCAKWQKIYP